MRRGIFSGDMAVLVRKVEQEFELFRYQTLSKSRREIFEASGKIEFYSCIHEYFVYSKNIRDIHVSACLQCSSVIAALYRVYMDYEYLRYSSWEDIEELLNVLAREQESGRTPMV